MVALLVLGVAITGLSQGIVLSLRSAKDSELQTTAAFLAAGQIELIRADGFLKARVSEGQGSGALSPYAWTETVTETPIPGLFEVAVAVRRDPSPGALYELRTLLFEPPAGSLTNRSANSREARERRNR
jgi:type II secretory pathway pseudopilin PulG